MLRAAKIRKLWRSMFSPSSWKCLSLITEREIYILMIIILKVFDFSYRRVYICFTLIENAELLVPVQIFKTKLLSLLANQSLSIKFCPNQCRSFQIRFPWPHKRRNFNFIPFIYFSCIDICFLWALPFYETWSSKFWWRGFLIQDL